MIYSLASKLKYLKFLFYSLLSTTTTTRQQWQYFAIAFIGPALGNSLFVSKKNATLHTFSVCQRQINNIKMELNIQSKCEQIKMWNLHKLTIQHGIYYKYGLYIFFSHSSQWKRHFSHELEISSDLWCHFLPYVPFFFFQMNEFKILFPPNIEKFSKKKTCLNKT